MKTEAMFEKLFGPGARHFTNIQIAVETNGDLVRVQSLSHGFGTEYRISKETADLHKFVMDRVALQSASVNAAKSVKGE
jgi:hypothetical protein